MQTNREQHTGRHVQEQLTARHAKEPRSTNRLLSLRALSGWVVDNAPTAVGTAVPAVVVAGLMTATPGTYEAVHTATTLNDESRQVSAFASEYLEGENGGRLWVDCDDDAIAAKSGEYDFSKMKKDGSKADYTYLAGFVQPIRFGTALWLPPVITLREELCDTILSFDPTPPTVNKDDPEYNMYLTRALGFADAAGTLMHEIEHTEQVLNEAHASCNAYQKLPAALTGLGMTQDDAETISSSAAAYYAYGAPDNYLSPECKPGGSYDLGVSDVYVNTTLG